MRRTTRLFGGFAALALAGGACEVSGSAKTGQPNDYGPPPEVTLEPGETGPALAALAPSRRKRGSAPWAGCPGDCAADLIDDACTACAKASCCAQYVACFSDPTSACTCWVSCKARGFNDAQCADPALCGPLDSASLATATCLNGNCPSECGLTSSGAADGGTSRNCSDGTCY